MRRLDLKEGFQVVIVSQLLLHQDKLRKLGVRLINIQINRRSINPILDLVLLRSLINIIKTEKPDIVLTYNIKLNVYGGIACQYTKTVYLPNITGLGTILTAPCCLKKIAMKLYKIGVAGASCVFFQNDENRRFFY